MPKPKLRRSSRRRLSSGFVARQLDPQEQRQRDGGDDRQPDDERRAEPVVLVAFLEHGLQRGEADRHGGDAGPVALAQQRQLHRRGSQRDHSMPSMSAPGTRLT